MRKVDAWENEGLVVTAVHGRLVDIDETGIIFVRIESSVKHVNVSRQNVTPLIEMLQEVEKLINKEDEKCLK